MKYKSPRSISISARWIEKLSYQEEGDILKLELIGGIKEYLKSFPKEFKEWGSDYLLDLRRDCKWDSSKLKENNHPLSCRQGESPEFVDVVLEKTNNLRIPEFIIW